MPRLPAVFLGFDKSGLSTGGGPQNEWPVRRLAMARWLFSHTNWRIAGGYPTIAGNRQRPAGLEHAAPYVGALLDENRGWSPIFWDLWTHGWGIGIFAVVLSRFSLYHNVPVPQGAPPVPPAPDNVARRGRLAARPVALLPYAQTPGAWDGPDFDTADLADQFFADAGRTQPTVVLNAANGTLHGRFLKWLMSVRHPELANPVVYIDNEDSNGTMFSADELAYYSALFAEMAARRPGEPGPLRPGIYAHGEIPGRDPDNSRSVVAQLAAVYPEIYLCQVGYGTRVYRSQLPIGQGGALANPSPAMNRFPVTGDAALHAINVEPGHGVGRRWVTWPAIKQWEGNNSSALPPGPAMAITFRGQTRQFAADAARSGWDFQAGIVPDPAYPAASPRLALASAGPICLLAVADRPDPPDDNTPATGRIAVYRVDQAGNVTQHGATLAPPQGHVILPGAELSWASDYLVTLGRRAADAACVPLAWHLTAAGMTPLDPIAAQPAIPVHAPIVGGASGATVHLFYATADGRIHHSSGDAGRPNAFQTVDQAAGHLLHPFSRLAATARLANTIDMVGVEADGTLAATGGAGQNAATAWSRIGTPGVLLPSTRLGLIAPNRDTLLALGVGSDLRLKASDWTRTRAGWAAPYAVGNNAAELLAPHTGIAAQAHDATTVDVLTVAEDATAELHRLTSGRGGAWSQAAAPVALGSPVAQGQVAADTVYTRVVHPMSDLGIARAGASTVVAAVWIEAGQSRAWVARRPDGAGFDMARGWGAWSAVPAPR